MYLGYQKGKIKLYTEKKFNEPTIEKWEETDLEYVLNGDEYVLNDEEYQKQKAQEEKERILALSMTRSDFFDGTIMAWGMSQEELLIVIQNLLLTLNIENTKKLIAINNFKNALNFYRKHELFNLLVNKPIQISESKQLIITNEHLDKFFDEVNKGNKETAWQYLPQPIPPQIETSYDDI